MDQFERVYRRRFYAIVGCGICVLLALTWGFIKGVLSPQGFAAAGLIWWVAMFAAIYLVVKSRQRSAEDHRRKQIASGIPAETIDRDRCVKGIRSLKRLTILFAVLLIYGIYATQGGPLLPRATGAGFDVFVVACCLYSIVRCQRRLKELSAGSAKKSPETD
jgi:FtsH-binding integral membrane protein